MGEKCHLCNRWKSVTNIQRSMSSSFLPTSVFITVYFSSNSSHPSKIMADLIHHSHLWLLYGLLLICITSTITLSILCAYSLIAPSQSSTSYFIIIGWCLAQSFYLNKYLLNERTKEKIHSLKCQSFLPGAVVQIILQCLTYLFQM